jgi:HAD superfamily hydrolase (TIGR01509 family)
LKEYKAYLFDMDGTLVSSEKLKGTAISKACSRFGGDVDVNVYKEVMGGSWEVVTKHFFEIMKISPNMDEFVFEYSIIYKELLRHQLKPTPNAKEFLIELSEKGKKIGLVSSSFSWMINQILEQLRLSDYFDIVVSKEDVQNHKPHPEAYLLALNRLSLSSSEVLIFEDTEAGLLSAKGANCDAIAIEHEFNSNNNLSLSLKIINDFSEVMNNTSNFKQI